MLSILLHTLVKSWTASDRAEALPLLRKNIKENQVKESRLSVTGVDWLELSHARQRGKNCRNLGYDSPDLILAGESVQQHI